MLRTLIVASLVFAIAPAFAAEVTGAARIVDGDTVQVGSTRIRLQGMDAPETDQICLDQKGESWACGIAARDQLTKHTGSSPWTCRGTAKIASVV